MTYQQTWHQKRYPKKIITFSEHLKSEDNEVVVSGIVLHGDSCKEKSEAVNKVDTCTKQVNK